MPGKGLAVFVSLALFSSPLLAQTNPPAKKYSSLERMKTAHLKAAHEDAESCEQRPEEPLSAVPERMAIVCRSGAA